MYLPEAEIVRRELERDVVGRKVKDVAVEVAKVVKRSGNRSLLAKALIGLKLSALERLGTHYVFTLDDGQRLVIAMSETTLVRRHANRDKVDGDTIVTITFTQGGQLRLLDADKALEMFIVDGESPIEEAVPELADLGMDLLAKPMAWTDFGREILSHDVKLKSLLTDQSVMVGLGDIYSDEILFESSLRYDRIASSLTTQELRRFSRAVVSVLNDAVKYRGTHIESSPFVDPAGEPGNYGDHLQVYGKHGELSPRSRQPLVRSKYGGRWTYYCEQSQV